MASSGRDAVILGVLIVCVAIALAALGVAAQPDPPPPANCSYTPECVGVAAGHMLGNTMLSSDPCCQILIRQRKNCWDYTVLMFQKGKADVPAWGEQAWSKCFTAVANST
ncbi:hypothetical protein Scep_008444 [Stephania cephalantha]|uniref:Prolamin-like domain-containing protein n=1 Tax=Stephania cephalantha TaxID=152367 RepID=A0AAP0KEC1_9MAGN